jgi:lipid-binding SYLF domain-containing protein
MFARPAARPFPAAALLATATLALSLVAGPAQADADNAARCAKTVAMFRKAGESSHFFGKSYGWAVFPNIGKGGLGVGGAYGNGCVYAGGRRTGGTSMVQLSVGFQAGGQAYSQIVFLKDKRAYDEFTSGNFEFGAGVSAIAITAAAGASAGSSGTSATASANKDQARTAGDFVKGMAVFTVAKGGLMYEATLAGQKFKFKAGG